MYMQHGQGHAASTWTFRIYMNTQHAWTWICSMDMDMQFGYGNEHGHKQGQIRVVLDG
jgi:hypothetical protein